MVLSKTVFLSDDDSDDRELFQEALEGICDDATLVLSSNGLQLLQQLEDRTLPQPDVIFLDINMPLMNGIECLKFIREQSDVPVVMFSTSANNSYIESVYKLRANLYIKKPELFEELRQVIKHVLHTDWTTKSFPLPIEEFLIA